MPFKPLLPILCLACVATSPAALVEIQVSTPVTGLPNPSVLLGQTVSTGDILTATITYDDSVPASMNVTSTTADYDNAIVCAEILFGNGVSVPMDLSNAGQARVQVFNDHLFSPGQPLVDYFSFNIVDTAGNAFTADLIDPTAGSVTSTALAGTAATSGAGFFVTGLSLGDAALEANAAYSAVFPDLGNIQTASFGVGSKAAVPEPSRALLVLFGLSIGVLRRKR